MFNFFYRKWINKIFILFIKVIFFLVLLISLTLIFKRGVRFLVIKFIKSKNFFWSKILHEKKVFDSISYFFPLFIGFILIHVFFYEYQYVYFFLEKIFNILFVLIVLQFLIRVINSIMKISKSENNHQTIAVHSFSQLLKITSIIFCILIIIAILTKNDLINILTSLGAVTAIVILVFKDIILGFVSSVQMASTKMIKVGDWIKISKHNVEGIVIEINLISAKIENFDKTITSIPTYDLISTSVTNFEIMKNKNIRRIKKSILFNIRSFHFCNLKNLKKFHHICLIKNYIEKKQKEIELNNEKKNINIDKLTNIGLFRKYALEYLNKNPNIVKSEIIMVRYLDPTTYGLPIEFYCFSNISESVKYEEIQSSIFDHLLTIAKEFNLEIAQILTINDKK